MEGEDKTLAEQLLQARLTIQLLNCEKQLAELRAERAREVVSDVGHKVAALRRALDHDFDSSLEEIVDKALAAIRERDQLRDKLVASASRIEQLEANSIKELFP